MAIIVEDGTGKADAQCYCDVAYLDAYMLERGVTLSQTESEKEAALVIAAKDWIDGEHCFAYEKLVETQALEFPRDNDIGLPSDILKANAAAANLQLNGALLVDTASISTGGIVEGEAKSVGPLSKSTTYAKNSAQIYSRILPQSLKKLLQPYLRNSAGLGRTYRIL